MKFGAIFDMDGLLFDTEPVYNNEWYHVAKQYKLNVNSNMLNELRGTSGDLMCTIVNRYWPTVDAVKLIDEVFHNAKLSLKTYVPIKKGAQELLLYLKENGVKLALASSSPLELIMSNLKQSSFDTYFNVIVSGEQVEKGKPAPDIFLLAAEQLTMSAKDCYVFEDGIHGVKAGVDAGCCTIMIPDLLKPTKEEYSTCTGIYESLSDVLAAFKNEEIA